MRRDEPRHSPTRDRQIIWSITEVAIIATDREGIVTDWNAGAEQILGWCADEVVGRSLEVFFMPEDRESGQAFKEMVIALETGRALDERWHLKRDGSRFWASGEMMPLLDDEDRHVGFVKVLRDRTEQTVAQRARQDDQEQLEAIFSQSPSFMALLRGPEHRFERVNPGYVKLVGGRDVVGRTVAEALPEAAAQGFTDLLDDVYHRGQAHHATDTPITLQASPDVAPEHLFLDFVYQPIRDADGHVVGIFVEGIDVTDRIAAARWLRETEDRYRALAENVDVGMCVIEMKFDADGKAVDYRIVDGNPAYERHTGLYGSVGKWVSEVAPGLELHWFDTYGNVALTGEPARFELGAAGLGNRMFEVEAHRVGDPDRHHVAILFTDVTDRRRAEEELRENVAFMRSVLAASSDCIKVLDLDANLVFMSEGGQQVMEVSDFNAIAGCPWPNFWDGEGHLAAKAAIASARAGMPAAFQGYADTMKGRRLYWDVQVSPIFGPDGRPERILSVSRDISALKASEEARAVLNQELSHRMKNLLAMVQAITAQTMRQARTMEEANEAVFTRISALARAQDILTRSNFEEADVGEVVGAAVGPHQMRDHRIEAHGPRLGLTAQQALGLSLAIHELATNAAKYGALSTETGRVAMSWGQINGAFKFEWIESGGPAVTPPTRRGFGSKLIERIVASYFDGEGRIDFDPAGIRFTLTGAPARPERIA